MSGHPGGGDMGRFDFDHWSELARRDPEGFFRARSIEIERFISAHPPEAARRLHEIQQRIDCSRAHAGSPMKALAALVAMMQDRLRLLRIQSELLLRASGRLRDEVAALEERRCPHDAATSKPALPVVAARHWIERRKSATR